MLGKVRVCWHCAKWRRKKVEWKILTLFWSAENCLYTLFLLFFSDANTSIHDKRDHSIFRMIYFDFILIFPEDMRKYRCWKILWHVELCKIMFENMCDKPNLLRNAFYKFKNSYWIVTLWKFSLNLTKLNMDSLWFDFWSW